MEKDDLHGSHPARVQLNTEQSPLSDIYRRMSPVFFVVVFFVMNVEGLFGVVMKSVLNVNEVCVSYETPTSSETTLDEMLKKSLKKWEHLIYWIMSGFRNVK